MSPKLHTQVNKWETIKEEVEMEDNNTGCFFIPRMNSAVLYNFLAHVQFLPACLEDLSVIYSK